MKSCSRGSCCAAWPTWSGSRPCTLPGNSVVLEMSFLGGRRWAPSKHGTDSGGSGLGMPPWEQLPQPQDGRKEPQPSALSLGHRGKVPSALSLPLTTNSYRYLPKPAVLVMSKWRWARLQSCSLCKGPCANSAMSPGLRSTSPRNEGDIQISQRKFLGGVPELTLGCRVSPVPGT